MNPSIEGQVLAWFERALAQPADQRAAWLRAQALPAAVHDRVLRLLEREATLGGFLESPPAPPVPVDFPDVGQRLGAYRLARRLDGGGMGVVFLAHRADDVYEQQVAIKLIRPTHLGIGAGFREQVVQRFEQERMLLARLQHPNIARILDGGSTPAGVPWLAMEYVDGVSLIRHADAQSLGVRARLALLHKVCEGVQEAHRHLIVHRDLKPENILVDRSGEPKLLDFGIAHALGEPAASGGDAPLASLTAMTPAYASPEQVRREPLTTSSDVYSLGVVLFQLLTGTRPYEIEHLPPAQAEQVVCAGPVPTLQAALDGSTLAPAEKRRRRRLLDRDLQAIVDKAMHKDAADRYPTAQALAADIARYLDGRPVLARPASAGYRFARFVGRHRVAGIAAAVALLAVLGGAGVALWQAGEARRSAADTVRVNDFLLEVLTLSDPGNTGTELTLGQVLENADAVIDRQFAERPDLASRVRHAIGYSMLSHYRIDSADRMLSRALAEAEAAHGPDSLEVFRILDGLAEAQREQGRTGEAVALYRRAIDGIERSGQQRDPIYTTVLNNLGLLYLIEEDYAAADTWLQRALAAMEQGRDEGAHPTDHASLVGNLAQVAHGLEDHPRADRLYRQAQAEVEAVFPDGSPDQAILLNNRALLAEDQGRKAESLELHRQSLAMRRKVFRHDHAMVAVALSQVARLAGEVASPGEALAAALEAAAVADRAYVEPHPYQASIHAVLARAHMLNDDLPAAGAALQRAQELLGRSGLRIPSAERYIHAARDDYCTRPAAQRQACAAAP